MKRRHFLGLAGLTGAVGVLPSISFGFPRLNLEAASGLEKLELSNDEWRERLSDEAFDVLRGHSTEPAFSSPLDKEWGEGEYRC
ncbi:MAG TPA: peptide-methionine (R)-S-oxide reductase, partial [Halomonas sp.]|nr:peptide-methionine (R)-S-oxide reductase [Halomonas sp.]